MKFTSLSQTGGYNLPPCNIVNLCGFHILFDCPLDLSALTIFSPISTALYENHETKKLLDKSNLILAEPYYKTVESLHLWNVSLIDVVLISSPMGMLGLPFLTRTEGFSAKVYATEVTARLGQLLMEDLVAMHMEYKQFYGPTETSLFQLLNWEELEALPPALKDVVLGKDGTELGSWLPLYSATDVKDCLKKVQSLKYAEEACYNGTLIIKALSSGLEIGSCTWSLKDPKRNISYISSSVFSSGTAMDFDFHALLGSDVLIYSDFASWNGTTCNESENSRSSIVPVDCSSKSDNEHAWELPNFDESSEEMEKLNFICSCSVDSIKAGGSVLIPIGRLGIILQLLELLALHIESSDIKVPIFIISSVAEELLAYTTILPEWLCKDRQEKLYSGMPVFAHEELIKEKKIHVFPSVHSHELLMMWQEPCIVVCPHWSLRLGPVVHLLQRWHGDPNALLVLEEGVDTNLALSPFKPIAMKVLECSFVSSIKSEKVPQLLKMLQPKLLLDDREEVIQAWYMDDSNEDQRLPHHKDPKEYVSLDKLAELGVLSWRLDADNYETDEELKKIRESRGYSYMDFCEVCPEKMPNYEEKIKSFFEEHLHTDEEIRYIVAGSGYFDVRDRNEAWIRVWLKKGGMIVLPAGIYHRFTLDTNNYVKAMRLFVGEPVWTPYNRPHDHLPARKEYVEAFVDKKGVAVA